MIKNEKKRRIYGLISILVAIVLVFTAMATRQPTQAATVYSDRQIAELAKPRTVRIDNNDNPLSGGSGVIIGKQGNKYIVLTANHVVKRGDFKYNILTITGKKYPAAEIKRLAKNKDDTDLAVIEFTSSEAYPLATIGNSDLAGELAKIYVAGYPVPGKDFGNERDYTIVPGSIISRPASRPRGYTMRYQAVTRGGMSGGPVFDAGGRVVGIHGVAESDGETQEVKSGESSPILLGFNAAIPVKSFMQMLSQANLKSDDLVTDNSDLVASSETSNPSQAYVYYTRGLSHYDLGNLPEAIADYTEAIRLQPDYADAYFYRGIARTDSGNYEGAVVDYTQAIQINPQSARAYYNRALLRYERGDSQGALADYTQAINSDRNLAPAYNNRGRIYADLKDLSQAIADFDLALQIDPNRANTYFNRGQAYYRLREYQKALEDQTQAISINPEYAKAYGNRGAARYRLGDKAGAIADLQTAAELFKAQGQMADYQKVLEMIKQIEAN
jgi:tetratricopeptide (TPR) repeat protein